MAFSTSDQSVEEVVFSGISRPQDLKDGIDDYLDFSAQATRPQTVARAYSAAAALM